LPPELLVWLVAAFKDSCPYQSEQRVMKAVAKGVVRPENVFGVRLKVLVLKETKRAAKQIGCDI
jgi:hypothetical protein